MKLHGFILTFFILQNTVSWAQVNHRQAFQNTLKLNKVGKEISFSKNRKDDFDSLALVYLGKLKTKKGQYLKIITSRWFSGYAPRATSRVVIFNNSNQYLGDYYLTMTYDIPDKIEGSSLVFVNKKESDCTPNLTTKISFKEGVPKQFFLKCKGESGDIYSFSQNL